MGRGLNDRQRYGAGCWCGMETTSHHHEVATIATIITAVAAAASASYSGYQMAQGAPGPKVPTPPQMPEIPKILAPQVAATPEQVAPITGTTEEARRASASALALRQRRGRASTLLTGPSGTFASPSAPSGLSTILGA